MNDQQFLLRDVEHEALSYYTKDIHIVRNQQYHIVKLAVDFNSDELIERFEKFLTEESRRLLNESEALVVVTNDPGHYVPASVMTSRGDVVVVFQIDVLEHVQASDPESFEVNLGEIITHELTHVKQCREGRLAINYAKEVLVWEGVERPLPTVDATMEYINLPWEVEAITAGLEYLVAKGKINSIEEGWDLVRGHIEAA